MTNQAKKVVLETLESRQLRAAVYPTAWEQYMVELINRARANPAGEASSFNGYVNSQSQTYNGDLNEGLSAGQISSAAKQPVAINPYLTDSARQHSSWQIANRTFSHTGAGGSDTGAREVAAGYSGATTWGENIAVNWSYPAAPAATETTFSQHRDLFTDMTIAGRGHRTNMMTSGFKEVGAGIASGLWPMSGYNTIAMVTTMDFGATANTYLTGVAYNDNVSGDHFYTPGEGLVGTTIVAKRISDGLTLSTSTWSSGGYSLALPAGTYNISATGGGLSSTVYYNSVSVGSTNVKRDFTYGQTADANPDASTGGNTGGTTTTTGGGTGSTSFAGITSRVLVVRGTTGADDIVVYRKSHNYYATLNGSTLSFSDSLIDSVAVLAGASADKITVGINVLKTYLDGGDGKDTINGGVGTDTIYGGAQPDMIKGNDGDDRINGNGGHDICYGGNGNDRMNGSTGNDTLMGDAGNDVLSGDEDNDSLDGGSGNDYLYGLAGTDYLNGNTGTDKVDNDSLDTRVATEVLM